MNRSELHGKATNLKGRIKETAGAVIGNTRLENEGAAERISGAAEAGLGKLGRKVDEAVTEINKSIKSKR